MNYAPFNSEEERNGYISFVTDMSQTIEKYRNNIPVNIMIEGLIRLASSLLYTSIRPNLTEEEKKGLDDNIKTSVFTAVQAGKGIAEKMMAMGKEGNNGN